MLPVRHTHHFRNLWRRLAAALALGTGMAACLAAGPGARSGAPSAARDPQHLIVEVSTRAPDSPPSFERRADRSYVVSTGGAGSRDDSAGSSNGRLLETATPDRLVRVRAGEALRVDLPGVQSLQFHVPVPSGVAPKAAGSTANATAGTGAGPAGSSVSGDVYFEAVTAFAARFAIAGGHVLITLQPLQVGGVSAPRLTTGADSRPEPIVLKGAIGAWIALGDTQLPPARSLTPTAEPPSPASVWVRVRPDPDAP